MSGSTKLARLKCWPLPSFDLRIEAEADGVEALRGLDDRWYALERGSGPVFRAVPVVFDEHGRILVGLRSFRGSDPTFGRLALPGDDGCVRDDQTIFEAGAEALAQIEWPFSGHDRRVLRDGLAACLFHQPMPVTAEIHDRTAVAVFCLPFIITNRELRETARVADAQYWAGGKLLWIDAGAVYASLGQSTAIDQLFKQEGLLPIEGFSEDLLIPLRRQLGGS